MKKDRELEWERNREREKERERERERERESEREKEDRGIKGGIHKIITQNYNTKLLNENNKQNYYTKLLPSILSHKSEH